jgi:TolB-like protein/class 3 adenylate cyclase/Flp pilus assembly protein TadD
MEPQDVERRLTTILSADVVGYSRLMGEDEAGTLAALKAHRKELIEPKAAQYHGRTVKLMGDGALMEFGSVVDAALFAIEVQCAMRDRNAGVPEDRQIIYRVGINIGDIIVEGDDIYGDGVNVASRLEGLAEVGGICVARNVRNQVRDKLDLDLDDLGEVEVKNIARPVRVFLVTPLVEEAAKPQRRWWPIAAAVMILFAFGGALWWQPWAPDVERADIEMMAFPLPDKPSIAVLPFDNLSGDPQHERLADGITEDIIADLSRYPDLFVIARNSVFTYKGKPVKVQEVAEDLGVRYVLEGSIQTDGNQARVTVQLIDALDGHHLWVERHELPLDDIFALQDEVTRATAGTLTGYAGRLAKSGREIARRKPPESLSAYDYYLLGIEHKHRFTKEDNAKAQELLQKAIELDPGFARAFVGLAWSHFIDIEQGWSPAAENSFDMFRTAVEKAIELDPTDGEAYTQLMYVYGQAGDADGAMRAVEQALHLGPSNAEVLMQTGWGMPFVTGKEGAVRAVELIQQAMRLNPDNPVWYPYGLGLAQYYAHQFEDAVETLRSARPVTNQVRQYLAVSYAQLGRDAEAAEVAAELLRHNPQFSGSGYTAFVGFANEEARAHFLEGVRKAGLPE